MLFNAKIVHSGLQITCIKYWFFKNKMCLSICVFDTVSMPTVHISHYFLYQYFLLIFLFWNLFLINFFTKKMYGNLIYLSVCNGKENVWYCFHIQQDFAQNRKLFLNCLIASNIINANSTEYGIIITLYMCHICYIYLNTMKSFKD